VLFRSADVLTHLSFHHVRDIAAPLDLRAHPRGADIPVYRLLQREPRTIDGVALALGGSLVEVAMALARLESAGWIAQADGWFECVGSPLR
jgi:predicted Rossmann fold nucleotide-binding protein DprA/Smf involved in DNA uptake